MVIIGLSICRSAFFQSKTGLRLVSSLFGTIGRARLFKWIEIFFRISNCINFDILFQIDENIFWYSNAISSLDLHWILMQLSGMVKGPPCYLAWMHWVFQMSLFRQILAAFKFQQFCQCIKNVRLSSNFDAFVVRILAGMVVVKGHPNQESEVFLEI